MIPSLVLTMTSPRPPSTRGMSVLRAYTRRPGLLIRLRPETTGTLPSTYLSCSRRRMVGPSRSSRTSAMKPSSLRIRAISRLVREAGTITSVWRALEALRTRVSMSAIGSETFIFLPARLRDAGQLADERPLAEADTAQREAAHERAGPAAHGAAVVPLHRVLGLALCLRDQRLLCHVTPPRALAGEGHAEELKQLLALLVGLRRRHDADLQPAETVHLVVIDLGKGELLAEAQRVVAPAVEGPARHAPEVADARKREPREALQEVPHPLAAKGDLYADGVAGPDAELGNRPLGAGDDRLLARDELQVADRGIHRLGVLEGLAQPDVDDDLVDLGHLVAVPVLELLHERRDHLGGVALPQLAAHDFTSRGSPQCPQTRTRVPLSSVRWPMRVGRSQWLQTTMTRLTGSGIAWSRMPPGSTVGMDPGPPCERWRGLVCLRTMLRPSTTTNTPPFRETRR